MQIRTLFLVCMTAFIAMASALGAWILTGAVNEYRQAGQVAMALDIDSALFSVADLIAAERPIVGGGLLADQAAGPAAMAVLAAIRRQADEAIIDADRLVALRSHPGALAQRDILRTIRDDLPAMRGKADAMLLRPKPQRDPAVFSRYLTVMNAMFQSLDFALDLGDLEAARHDGVTMDIVQLSRMGWSVRRLIGSRTAPLMAAIAAGAPLAETQIEQLAQISGSLKLSWSLATSLSRRLESVPGIVGPVQAAYGAFIDYDRLCQSVIAASQSGAHYAVSADDVGSAATKAAQALKALRETAVRLARDHIADSQRAATLGVVTASTAVLLTISVSLLLLAILKRRIVSPVLALTDVIGRLARRDYTAAPLVTHGADEIGRMAAAIDVLRKAGIEAERSEARIAHMARHDALTGLANRTLLHERIEQALSLAGRGQPCAVLCLDLDRFKGINDMYGHPVGDLLLRAVAERLNACVRETDTASRLGGDEFVVLLVGLQQPDDAGLLAARIIRTLDEPLGLDGQTVTVGVSVGIAIAPQDASSAVGLLKCADMALYRAKSEEPGSYRFFEPDMDARLQARMALERELREAILTEAFELLYQPQYNLASGTLSGFEALIRWHHPTRGMVSPAAFIPLAEETGLITAIGAWVLREATKEAMHWPVHVKLAVNLSAVQFKSATLVSTVREALAESGLAPTRLEVEITESVLLKNNVTTLAALHALNELGVSIAMDDFGTGYSSLSYLRSFPFDNIKIDQSFVRDMSQHSGARAIVRAIVALGDSLGMTTTAEGVETADQLAQLRLVGCTEVQGYLFSKPAQAAAARLMVGGRIEADSMTA